MYNWITNFCEIQTVISREDEIEELLNFKITCCKSSLEHGLETTMTLGQLEGFIIQTNYFPTDADDDWLSHIFEDRCNHTDDAFQVIIKNIGDVVNVLDIDSDDIDWSFGLVMLEKAWVHPEYRGNKIALRLIREAKQIFNRKGLFVILKAHPDDGGISDQSCIRLAEYYRSDETLALEHLSRQAAPGWLMGRWDSFTLQQTDD